MFSFHFAVPVRQGFSVKLYFSVSVRLIGSLLAVAMHFKEGVALQESKPWSN